MKRILVTGGRGWTDYDIILHALRHADEPDDKVDVVIHGGARGADSLAHQAALQLGLDVIVEFADWEREGRAAGLIRNQLMIDKHHPTHVFAFPSPNSRGTYDMIRRAEKANIPVTIFSTTKS